MEKRTQRGPTQDDLKGLFEKWEPEASASSPSFRMATCVVCGERMFEMWHVWFRDKSAAKELHFCRDCGADYGLFV